MNKRRFVLSFGGVLCGTVFCGVLLLFFLAGQVRAADGDLAWARSFGQSLDDVGYDVFVDAAGNVYATGYFQGTVDFDPAPGSTANLTSAGNNDIFLTKLDPSGNLVWARSFGGFFDDIGWGVFVDRTGNVYTTGYFQGANIDFDPGPGTALLSSTGSADIFISKLDSDGNFIGAWAMGGTSFDYGFGIFVDDSGNIYTIGYFRNTVDFDPGAGTTTLTSAGVQDIFISKLTGAGVFAWARRIGGTGDDEGLGISLYAGGHLYLTGWFQGTVDFDPGPGTTSLTSAGSFDIFVSKLDSDGNFVWARGMGGISDDRGQAVAVDGAGNVYTTGWFSGSADFDPGPGTFPLVSSGGIVSDIFVSKLDGSGNFVWARGMGGSAADVGYGIAVDSAANVYTTGGFGDSADFDPGAGTLLLASAGMEDIFVSKLDSDGSLVWAKAMGGTAVDYGYDVAVTSAGAVHLTGSFRGSVDFDPGPGSLALDSAGFEDIFICRLNGPDPIRAPSFPWAMYLPAITAQAKRSGAR